MRISRRQKLAIGAGAALLAAGGGAAIGAAQSSPSTQSKAVVEDAAKQLGIDADKLSDALKQALENQVDEAVKSGRLTEEQAARLKERIQSDDYPLFGAPGLRGLGPPGPGLGIGPLRRMGPLGLSGGLEAAATYLGVTQESLRADLRKGQTLAEVAKERGKSVDGLVNALVAEQTKRLDAAVAAGRLTKARRDELVAALKEHTTAVVNGERPLRAKPFGRKHGLALGPFGAFRSLETAATYLGVTQESLRQSLADGKTMAAIAKEKGKSVSGLVDAILAEQTKRLDAAVAAGRLTQAQRDELVAALKEHTTAMVNGERSLVRPWRGAGKVFGRGRGHGFGFGGPRPALPPRESASYPAGDELPPAA